jgi:hypothetical protein
MRVRVSDLIPELRNRVLVFGRVPGTWLTRGGTGTDVARTTTARRLEGSFEVLDLFDTWTVRRCNVRNTSTTRGMYSVRMDMLQTLLVI